MGDIVKVQCPGFTGPKGGFISCPELARRSGHRPGTGKGYSEGWDRKCYWCANYGFVMMLAYVEESDDYYY